MSKKIKVAFVTPKMIIGGAESYIINKSNWLINNGFDVIIVSQGGENVSNLPNGVNHIFFDKISSSPLEFSYKDYSDFIEKLSDILLRNDVDVIEAHNSYPAVHVASSYKYTKIPFFINILNEVAYYRNPLLTILTKKLSCFGLFYVLSYEMNRYIEKRINFKLNPKIIPIPVKAISRDNLSLENKYILSVSRLSEDKDYVRYLIKDFYELYKINDKLSEYKLVIVGDGSLFESINVLANSLNKEANRNIIQLRGTLVGDDFETVYKNCSIFVGMATTLLLAASCGKPSVIAGSTPETNKFSWGLWGENDLDANLIGICSGKDRTSTSFQTILESLVECEGRLISSGNAAYKMFKENYDFGSIMTVWGNEYHLVIDTFLTNGVEIEKELNFLHLWRLFYREIRRVIKFLRL
ncbi:glycosyltransferase [Flavobacterium yafengii]|uniref:Glycosyltransferase n=1 Tax=Flavobacterium yafengii TaxID=3041253 RepID=A0AAW6TSF1_9FLAO|nr:glycosyltransferase [Flavobacterium yafengii]MDI5950745.1 glycosyltransferase [Flavobacterium yafengii]